MKRFCQEINYLTFTWDNAHPKFPCNNLLANKVKVHLDVFYMGMEHKIRREVGGSNIIAPQCEVGGVMYSSRKKRIYLNQFEGGINNGFILNLNAWLSNCELFLGSLGN